MIKSSCRGGTARKRAFIRSPKSPLSSFLNQARFLLLAVAALLPGVPAGAQQLEGKVVEHTLKNGMKFLFFERPEAPVFSGVIVFRVGGVDEHVGITGIAHMFEHMAFKGNRVIGTRNYAAEEAIMRRADEAAERLRRLLAEPNPDPQQVAKLRKEVTDIEAEARPHIVKDELDEIYSRNGGTGLNASTSRDVTNYYISLPSNRFELWALLESQRIADPVLREFYSERDVVAEERRLRTDTQPDGKLYEATTGAAYLAHPYGSPTIGWMSDILNLTREQALAFRKTYYVPNNAVAAIVGDIRPSEAIPIIEKYFGPIPAGPAPPPVGTKEPPQEGERRVEVAFDAEPQFTMMFHKPALPHVDDFVFNVIDSLLTEGRTSRLYRTLVRDKRIATDVGSTPAYPGERYQNLFVVAATPRHPHTVAEVETAIMAEIERLKTERVPDEELQKVKNNAEAAFVYALQSNMGLASQLAEYQAVAGDWRYLIRWRDTIRKITADDVMRVAKQYLTKSNRTFGQIVRPEAPAGAGGSAPGNAGAAGGSL